MRKIRGELGLTQGEFAELAGVAPASVSRMESGQVPPSPEVLYYLSRHHPQVDVRELLCGEPTPSRVDAIDIAAHVKPVIRPLSAGGKEAAADDYFAVPLVEGRAAAGFGGVVWDKVKSLVWVYRPELGRRRNLVAVRVAGDSMKPTVPDGSIVIVDRDQWMPEGKRRFVWALRTAEGDTVIKRLHKVNGSLLILSDNFMDYPPEPAWTAELGKLVIGKVIWMWHSLESHPGPAWPSWPLSHEE
ncbi:MAG: LexA family transcriptional regulator [Proteobacteria bacterium]|nr:LexA family transcriptional regulator [Pseudomonadota bacterium]MBU4381603.1 LexA family transcriptional regulator [Pseudomonadota bacterium]